jgi:hypothetical protein
LISSPDSEAVDTTASVARRVIDPLVDDAELDKGHES